MNVLHTLYLFQPLSKFRDRLGDNEIYGPIDDAICRNRGLNDAQEGDLYSCDHIVSISTTQNTVNSCLLADNGSFPAAMSIRNNCSFRLCN